MDRRVSEAAGRASLARVARVYGELRSGIHVLCLNFNIYNLYGGKVLHLIVNSEVGGLFVG